MKSDVSVLVVARVDAFRGGHTGDLEKIFFGGTAEKVVRAASCPVRSYAQGGAGISVAMIAQQTRQHIEEEHPLEFWHMCVLCGRRTRDRLCDECKLTAKEEATATKHDVSKRG